jgi:hypothetical protein
MAFPFMAAAVALTEMVPIISRWFSNTEEGSASTQMIATKVVDIAKKVTGCKDPMSAVEALQKDSKLLLDFQRDIIRLDQDLEKSYLRDRQDARARDVAMATAGRYNVRADIMVIAAALGLIFCLLSLTCYQGALPGEAVGIISTVAGIFGGCLKDAYSFEFGSSRGSKNKDLTVMLGAGGR